MRFTQYIQTIDPYVPWDADVLREQLLESFDLTVH